MNLKQLVNKELRHLILNLSCVTMVKKELISHTHGTPSPAERVAFWSQSSNAGYLFYE